MKIQDLNLAAFGPFTDKSLAFEKKGISLHIIYGPNEAGKSSALRGLRSLLYGIEVQTSDNFIHENKNLRIHARLQNTDGHELTFVRRKGKVKTLLTPDGEPLDEDVLTPFLRGVTEELFINLFGIDHKALQHGGDEILQQKGEVGQAIFTAATGSHALHSVLDRLGEEAEDLFLPNGSKQKISSALKEYSDLKKKIRDRSLSPGEWDTCFRTFETTMKALEAIESELSASKVEVNRLNRIQQLLPKLAQRHEFSQELESLKDVVVLADDFSERHRLAIKEMDNARAILGQEQPRLVDLEQQLAGFSINQALLDQSESIEDLHSRLAEYRNSQQERPHLDAQQKQLLREAEVLLKEVRPDIGMADIDILRPLLVKRQSLTKLASENKELISNIKQIVANQRKTTSALKVEHKDYGELPDMDTSDSLRIAITAAQKQGDIDSTIQTDKSELTTLNVQCNDGLSRLTLWQGKLADLTALEVPNKGSIDHFKSEFDKISARLQRLEEKRDDATDELRDVLQSLDEIQRAGAVPTEENLISVRSNRDQIWRLLRRQWIDGDDITAETCDLNVEVTLPDTFENHVNDADELSDRLRREADRVHKTASLQAKQNTVNLFSEDIVKQLDKCSVEKSKLDKEWEALWSPTQICPRTPREMQIWLDEKEKLCDQVKALNDLSQEITELKNIRVTHIQSLNQQLELLGKTASISDELEPLLLKCDGIVRQVDDIKQQRKTLDIKVKDLEAELELLSGSHQLALENLDAWEQQWLALKELTGLQSDTTPSEVPDLIEKVRELFDKQSDAEKLQGQIKVIDDDATSFSKQVMSLSESIAQEFKDLPADDSVTGLNLLLTDTKTKQAEFKQINIQLEQARKEVQKSNSTIKTMAVRLDSLCAEAKCNKYTELEEAERNSTKYLRCTEKKSAIEQEMLQIGNGASIADLEAETEGIDSDALPGQIDVLNNKIIDDLEPKQKVLLESKGREKLELESMDDSNEVAILAEEAQTLLAGIRADAEQFSRLKLAGRILRDEIERYRKENQGPVIKRASECFSELTCGSFAGLKTDFNNKDEPVLVGLRTNGERVDVSGMSSGSRDQLYLALRIASLEQYMETSEQMPFIVDDILVEFDDQRSEAALKALVKLSEKTQVILFTHHSRVVEQAQKIKTVQIHNL